MKLESRLIDLLLIFFIILIFRCNHHTTDPNDNVSEEISGYIYDGSKRFNVNYPLPKSSIKYKSFVTTSDDSGYFCLKYSGSLDPLLEIKRDGYQVYYEKPSRMVNGAFYLIPSGQVYKDFCILTWDYAHNNPQNWHRKWDKQTEFYIIQNSASDKQIQDLKSILQQDEYQKMTGGLYHSNVGVYVLQTDPAWTYNQRKGKTKIYFLDGIIPGGIAHSEDGGDGIIDYSEIGWDTNQEIDKNIVWHELSHTVTAGGHINYRRSVNSETEGGGKVFPEDEKAFNCIYNSPPRRIRLE